MRKPTTRLEVIDPKTNLKMDVIVSFHHTCSLNPDICGEDVERVVEVGSMLIRLLKDQGFGLSDLETHDDREN